MGIPSGCSRLTLPDRVGNEEIRKKMNVHTNITDPVEDSKKKESTPVFLRPKELKLEHFVYYRVFINP